MKRSEFLKRFGLGVAAAVTAPALLKGEDGHTCETKLGDECLYDVGKAERLVFWKQTIDFDHGHIIPTSCYPLPLTPTEDSENIWKRFQ